MAIEDSAVLAELLADDRVQTASEIEAVFATFNQVRKDRGQWLVKASRRAGDLYEWRAECIGKDFKKIEDEINRSNAVIAEVNVRQLCNEAISVLSSKLANTTRAQL